VDGRKQLRRLAVWTVITRAAGIVLSAIAIWGLFGFFAAQRACAHDPQFPCSPRDASHAVRVADATRSTAFYGHLRAGETDVFELALTRPQAVPWNLLIDDRDVENPARPSATLSSADGRVLQTIDFRDATQAYEPFSRERYLATPIVSTQLKPGTYRVVVDMHGGSGSQRYVLAVGAAERWSVGEIPYLLGAIHRIRTQKY
jgi:hypothetical protein